MYSEEEICPHEEELRNMFAREYEKQRENTTCCKSWMLSLFILVAMFVAVMAVIAVGITIIEPNGE